MEATTVDTGPSNRSRVFGLDVLRAVAVSSVLAGHLALAAAGLGQIPTTGATTYAANLGVQIFFVLSGFLIGGLLLDIMERGARAREWRIFLVRRWMRTLPLYMFWVLLLLAIYPPRTDVAAHAIQYLTFTQNFAWPMPRDNWIGVSWTLTIEEWFYLLFSALLVFLARFGTGRAVAISCITFLLVPLLVRILGGPIGNVIDTGFRKIAIYRLDAIAYGVLAVVLWRSFAAQLIRWRLVLALVGTGLLIVLYLADEQLRLDVHWLALSYSLTPLALAMIFPAAISLRAARGFVRNLIQWVSERSYSLYLTHLDIFNWTFLAVTSWHILPPILCLPVALSGALIVSDVCFRLIERPIMKRRPKQLSPLLAPA